MKKSFSFISSLICISVIIVLFSLIVFRFITDRLDMLFDNEYLHILAEREDELVVNNTEKITEINHVPLPDKVTEWGIEEYSFDNQILENENNKEEHQDSLLLSANKLVKVCFENRSKRFYINKAIDNLAWNLEEMVFDGRLSEENDLIFQLRNGYYTYNEPLLSSRKLEEKAESVYALQQFCDEKSIPFIYINAGTKVCPIDKQLPFGMTDYTNENQDIFLKYLYERKVNYIDLREKMISEDLDWYNSYYITDAHLTNRTGLWIAKLIANELNQNYKFSFDINYFNENQYEIERYEKYWLGEFGKKIPLSPHYREAFDMMTPKYETDYTYYIPATNQKYYGSYNNSLFNMDLFNALSTFSEEDYLQYPGAYGCSRIRNYSNSIITNNLMTNNDKKILFIQDSFGYYSASFLAKDITSIELLHPEMFSGSIETYISTSNPDIVIMLYTSRELEEENNDMYNLK